LPAVTPDIVANAYDALASGDRTRIDQYWDPNLVWVVPGHNPLSGMYNGLDQFLDFMSTVASLSGNSFRMERVSIMVSEEYSADVTHNVGYRNGDENGQVPYQKLDIDVVHVLRWRNGKIVEGRGAIFADGATAYDQFWSRIGTQQ
jgi:ketosteroid isomerase-like protein